MERETVSLLSKRIVRIMAVVFSLTLISPAAADQTPRERLNASLARVRPSYEATTIDDLLALQDDAFDIATTALLIERELDPTIDVAALRADLDATAAALAHSLPENATRREVLDAIAVHFRTLPVAGEGEVDPRQGMLSHVLSGKPGNCQGRSVLVFSLCQRLDVPASLLDLPGHVLVRAESAEARLYLDTAWDPEDAKVVEQKVADERDYYLGRIVASPEGLASMAYANRGALFLSYAQDRPDRDLVPARVRPACIPAAFDITGSFLKYGRQDIERALALDPRNSSAWGNSATVLLTLGRQAEALNASARAISLTPDNTVAYLKRAHMRYELGDDVGAINDATRALHWGGRNEQAIRIRAKALRRAGILAGLEEDLQAQARSAPSEIGAWQQLGEIYRDYRDLEETIGPTIQVGIGKSGRAEGSFEGALACFVDNDALEAINFLDSAIEKGMNNPKVYATRGKAHTLCGDTAAARTDYEKAANLTASTAEDHHWRAEAFLALEQWPNAERDAAKAIELEPFVSDHQILRAAALIGLKRYDEAKTILNRVIEHRAEAYDAHARLATIAARQADAEAFDTHMQIALSARYTDPDMWRTYIEGCQTLGRQKEVQAAIEEAKKLGVTLPNLPATPQPQTRPPAVTK